MAVDPRFQRVSIRYRSDDGNDYSIVTSKNHADAIPGTASGVGFPPFPKKWKPRVIHGVIINPTDRDRKITIVAYSRVIAPFTGPDTTIDVAPYGTFQITGRTAESRTIAAPDYDGVGTPAQERVAIKYTADDGNDYRVVTTRGHANAVGAVGAGNVPAFPKRWKTRHYDLLADDLAGPDQRLILVEPNPLSSNWMSDAATTFNLPMSTGIVPFHVTGRRKELRPRSAPGYTP